MTLQDVKDKYNKYNESLSKDYTMQELWEKIQELYDLMEITEEAYLKLKKVYIAGGGKDKHGKA